VIGPARLVASLTTPIGLIKHAAVAERRWFQRILLGLDESECDGYARSVSAAGAAQPSPNRARALPWAILRRSSSLIGARSIHAAPSALSA
jgi:hypothetical protein